MNRTNIKAATVSQESDGKYYISVLFEFETPVCTYTADITNAIGLDYASDGLYTDHNGNKGTDHKFYRESHAKLAKEQRRLSRKVGNKKGSAKSSNYLKQFQKVNKIHRHIANQRLDNLHKISTEIANQYDVVWKICLPMTNIGANKKPAITLQGNLKEAVVDALDKDHQSMLTSGDKYIQNSRTYSQDMTVEQNQ